MLPTHELVKSQNFRGLKMEEATKLENYVHFRKPQSQEKKLIICKKTII